MDLNSNKITFKNDLITNGLLLIGTLIFSFIIKVIFKKFDELPNQTAWYYGFCFGGGASICFFVIFTICGGLKNATSIFLERWINFFSNIRISLKYAFRSLLDSYIDDGCALLVYILNFVFELFLCYYGTIHLVELYL